jgi:hypothetical protein
MLGAGALLIVVVLLFAGSGTPQKDRLADNRKDANSTVERSRTPVSSVPAQTPEQSRGQPAENSGPHIQSVPASDAPANPQAVVKEDSLEREAQAALDEILRGDAKIETRIQSLEKFAEKYDHTTVSVRAMLQLRELKATLADQSTPSPAKSDDTLKVSTSSASQPTPAPVTAPPPTEAPQTDDTDREKTAKADNENKNAGGQNKADPAANAKADPNEAAIKAALARMKNLADAGDRNSLGEIVRNFKRSFAKVEMTPENRALIKAYEIKSDMPIVPEGLVAYFPLYEGSGMTVTDAVKMTRTGQISNCTWSEDALACNGQNSMVTITQLPMQNSALTFSAWVKHSQNTGCYERYIAIGADAVILRRNKDGKLEFVVKPNGKFEWAVSNEPLEINRWYSVAGTWDGKMLRLYRDGALIVSASHPGKIAPTNDAALSWSDNEAMCGLLSEVRIYGRALSDAEIRQLADPKCRHNHN